MPLTNVTAGNTANAADLNQYKSALEGTTSFAPTIVAGAADIVLQLADAAGSYKLQVQDSTGTAGLTVNSSGIVTPTIFQVTGVATPADTGAGRVSYDTTKNVLVYGNGTQVVEIADGASTTVIPLLAQRTADPSSVTFQTLSDFNVTLAANSTYVVELLLIYLTGTTPDIQFQWNIASLTGTTIQWGSTGPPFLNLSTAPAASTDFNAMHDEGEILKLKGNGTSANDKTVVPVFATIHTDATGGQLEFQWAQLVADASSTTLEKGSYMKVTRNA